MADITLLPGKLQGEAAIPPSKSISHRALILSALSGGSTGPIMQSEDLRATQDCLKVLGQPRPEFDCKQSGSTLRFMIPLAMALSEGGTFHRQGKLKDRPIDLYKKLFPHTVFSNSEPLKITGKLMPGHYTLRGDVSSQFITGLLMALPLLDTDSEIHVTDPFESTGYVDLTLNVMHAFGMTIDRPTLHDFYIKGRRHYQPCDYLIEGDYSQAAVILAAAALGHDVRLKGLSRDSKQGDRAILEVLTRMGAQHVFENGLLCVKAPDRLKAVDVDAAQCPDIIPIIALLNCLAQGQSVIYNAGRLRIKECDRLCATTDLLKALGADIKSDDSAMYINGVSSLKGGKVLDCMNDHRMAMLLSVAALDALEPITLQGVECIDKSWPGYFDTYFQLGGKQA